MRFGDLWLGKVWQACYVAVRSGEDGRGEVGYGRYVEVRYRCVRCVWLRGVWQARMGESG